MKYLLLSISLLLLVACNEQSRINHPSESLQKNQTLWKKANIQNYRFVAKRFCFCPQEEKRLVSVLNGTIAESKFIPSNTPTQDITKTKKVEDYFAVIRDALDKNAHSITVTYNITYGFPEKISIDYDKRMADEEMSYTITKFNETLTDGTIACTQEYMPVCGKVDIRCVMQPCKPMEQTFSNKCMLHANPNATYLRDGEC